MVVTSGWRKGEKILAFFNGYRDSDLQGKKF